MPEAAQFRAAVQQWVGRAEQDPRIHACWLEGPTPQAIRAWDGPLDLHVGVADPDFEALIEELVAFLAAAAPVRQHADGPAPPEAWAVVAQLDGLGAVTCTLERMSLVGKRGRAAVQPLFDRTGQLRHVLSYTAGPRVPPAPREGGTPVPRHPDLLDDAAIAAGLGGLPEWHRQGGELLASFQMPSFLSGVKLVGEVALAAEQADHHPNILVRYRTVAFSLSTHAAGGITQRDLDLAAAISALATAPRHAAPAKPAPAKRKKKAAAKKPTKKQPAAKKRKQPKKPATKRAAKKKAPAARRAPARRR